MINEIIRTKGNSLVIGQGNSRADAEIFFAQSCYGSEHRTDQDERFGRFARHVDPRRLDRARWRLEFRPGRDDRVPSASRSAVRARARWAGRCRGAGQFAHGVAGQRPLQRHSARPARAHRGRERPGGRPAAARRRVVRPGWFPERLDARRRRRAAAAAGPGGAAAARAAGRRARAGRRSREPAPIR